MLIIPTSKYAFKLLGTPPYSRTSSFSKLIFISLGQKLPLSVRLIFILIIDVPSATTPTGGSYPAILSSDGFIQSNLTSISIGGSGIISISV